MKWNIYEGEMNEAAKAGMFGILLGALAGGGSAVGLLQATGNPFVAVFSSFLAVAVVGQIYVRILCSRVSVREEAPAPRDILKTNIDEFYVRERLNPDALTTDEEKGD